MLYEDVNEVIVEATHALKNGNIDELENMMFLINQSNLGRETATALSDMCEEMINSIKKEK